MKADKPIQEKPVKKRFKVSSPGTKTLSTDNLDEANNELESLKLIKARSIDMSDENDKSTIHYTRGVFENNYHARVSWTK